MTEAWAFEHSVVCPASRDFAWNFWTDVKNWVLDADVESIEIDGAFRSGARGATHTKSFGRVEWSIADTEPGRAVLEFPAPGAIARLVWTFADQQGWVKITQRATLSGENAAAYVESVGRGLEAGIPAGMQKLSDAIEAAFRNS